MQEYIVRLKISESEAIRDSTTVIESFLKERARDIPPTPWLSGGVPSGGAIPADGPMLYGGDVDMIPGRTADVSNYQSAVGGRIWRINGSREAMEALKETYGDRIKEIVPAPAFGREVPEPQVMLLADRPGETESSYHLKKLGVDSSLHSRANGSRVIVSIIDSGMWKSHSEFDGTDIVREDSYDYEKCEGGWRGIRGKVTYCVYEGGEVLTLYYHGTAVTGLLCGRSSGVAPGVSVIQHTVFREKVIPQFPVEVAVLQSVVDSADIIVTSLGTEVRSDVYENEVRNVKKYGGLLVAAAGNFGPNTQCSPADYPAVLSVGATDAEDGGWEKTSVARIREGDASFLKPDIWAPGVNLRVPVPECVAPSGYITGSGTSFAAPLVAGVAALVLGWYREHEKTIRAIEIREHLLETADDITLPDELGGGKGKRVNAARAVKCLKVTVPT